MQKQELVDIRGGNALDKNFILATMLRGLYYGNTWFGAIPKNIFMQRYHTILERLLAHPDTVVTIACLKDDAEVVLGYSIYRKTHDTIILDYIFVKSAWRRIGIAKSLLPNNIFAVTHLTRPGASIMKSKLPNIPYNPFLL